MIQRRGCVGFDYLVRWSPQYQGFNTHSLKILSLCFIPEHLDDSQPLKFVQRKTLFSPAPHPAPSSTSLLHFNTGKNNKQTWKGFLDLPTLLWKNVRLTKCSRNNSQRKLVNIYLQHLFLFICLILTEHLKIMDGMGREEGGGFRMGNTCIPVADSFWYLAKLIQLCKV